jgi:thymidylate synthase ThyX
MFITVIVSATEYSNWFHLRDHKDAQPEIAWVAAEMHRIYNMHRPTELAAGMWHLPLVGNREIESVDIETAKKISVGRCARVSYLTHDGVRDIAEDVKLHDKLCAGPATGEPGHWSPFEHVAQAQAEATPSGNFTGWTQYRKAFAAEHFTR